jgi:hypothetical protein
LSATSCRKTQSQMEPLTQPADDLSTSGAATSEKIASLTAFAAKWPEEYWALIIFAAAVIVRLLIALATRAFSGIPLGEAFNVARSIASTGEFANPYALRTGPTAHVAPVYPYLMSGAIRLFGDGTEAHVFLTVAAIICSSAIWASLPFLARRLKLPAIVGIIGGALGAVNPLPHYTELDGTWESLVAAMGAAWLVAAVYGCRAHMPYQAALLLGLAGGALTLTHPASLMILVACSLWLLLMQGERALKPLGTAALAFLLVLAPWTIRNAIVMRGYFFVRDNYGLELAVSNRSGASPTWVENLDPAGLARHPDVTPEEAVKVRDMGEVAYNAARGSEALKWIAAQPKAFLWLTAIRVAHFWVPARKSKGLTGLEIGITVAAFAGMIGLFRHRRDVALLLCGIWLLYPTAYYPIQIVERYRYPIYWTLILCAGNLVSLLFKPKTGAEASGSVSDSSPSQYLLSD